MTSGGHWNDTNCNEHRLYICEQTSRSTKDNMLIKVHGGGGGAKKIATHNRGKVSCER